MSLKLRWPPLSALLVVLAVLVLDQVTKAIVEINMARLPARVFGGVQIEYVRNTGVSFSLFTGRGWAIIALVSVVVVVLLVTLFFVPRRYAIPMALILGGSIGNLIDRLRTGSVMDFVAVYWWPRFNVADLAIVVGAIAMVLMVFVHATEGPRGADGHLGLHGEDQRGHAAPGPPGGDGVPPADDGDTAARDGGE